MTKFTIEPNQYLSRRTEAFFHQEYTNFRAPGNPDAINHLKNQFNGTSVDILKSAYNKVYLILSEDLPQIKALYSNTNLTVCVIPRAKTDNCYSSKQLYFRQVISDVVNKLDGYSDGTIYMARHTDTRTTHMDKNGRGGDGKLPYPGITKDTCNISADVEGKDILLIDDLYTKTINIDEDAIQALLDKGANSVIFYSVGSTASKN